MLVENLSKLITGYIHIIVDKDIVKLNPVCNIVVKMLQNFTISIYLKRFSASEVTFFGGHRIALSLPINDL